MVQITYEKAHKRLNKLRTRTQRIKQIRKWHQKEQISAKVGGDLLAVISTKKGNS